MTEITQGFSEAQQTFLIFINQIEEEKISQISVRRAIKKYDVKNLKINNVTPLRAKKMYAAITLKYSNGITTDKSWLENERRLFIWCTLCYLYKNQLEIKDLKLADFQFLRQMFPKKDLNLIKFQIYSLVKRDNKSSGWDVEEEKLLEKLVKKQTEKDIQWSNISKQFFIQSEEKYFRNAKQCRQRWLNYLDPNKQKGKWEKQQDIILMKQVLEKGKKWSKIVDSLGGKKNQHMIKNRYKSLIHKKEKSCKSLKLKQHDIIKLILRDYDGNQQQDSPQSNEIQEEESNANEQKVVDSQESNGEKNDLSQKQLQKNQEYIKQEHSYDKNSNFLKGFNSWPIVIQHNSFVNINRQRNGKQCKSTEQEKDNPKQIEVYGSKADKQFVNNLFFSVNTPVADDNRFFSGLFESRSPFLPSPYAAWTPSIVFNEDPQVLQSPLGFSDFSATARNFTNSIQKKG